MGPNFSQEICKKFDTFSEIFFQKIDVLRFNMALNGNIFKNIDKITYKTPYRPFLEF